MAGAKADRQERIARLRAQMRALESGSRGAASQALPTPRREATPQGEAAGRGAFSRPGEEPVATPAQLAALLPGGGLLRRRAVQCEECPALVVEVIAHLTARGGYVGLVGWPELSLVQVAEEGDLDKVAVIPDPGPEPWSVVGVLAEGLDLIVHRSAAGEFSPARARPVLGKLRSGRAALLTVGGRLPGTTTSIGARVTGYHGLGRGSGRITGVDIAVQVRAKSAPPAAGVLSCGGDPGREAA